jgi:4-amino-4-deoxy-L-arabinose transferase-like glycosyltransferase
MFSKGQQVFALFFIIAFAILLIWSYRKDIKLHKKYYKNVWVVGLGIILVIAAFALVTFLLHE